MQLLRQWLRLKSDTLHCKTKRLEESSKGFMQGKIVKQAKSRLILRRVRQMLIPRNDVARRI